jgi:hypothetical protein
VAVSHRLSRVYNANRNSAVSYRIPHVETDGLNRIEAIGIPGRTHRRTLG